MCGWVGPARSTWLPESYLGSSVSLTLMSRVILVSLCKVASPWSPSLRRVARVTEVFNFFLIYFKKIIYFCLHWVLAAVHGLSLAEMIGATL